MVVPPLTTPFLVGPHLQSQAIILQDIVHDATRVPLIRIASKIPRPRDGGNRSRGDERSGSRRSGGGRGRCRTSACQYTKRHEQKHTKNTIARGVAMLNES